MFIPPFWCGALATVGIEILALIICAVYLDKKGRQKTNECRKEESACQK